MTAVVHSDDGKLCLYAGNGLAPYYDTQGLDASGAVTAASPGSVAYAGTLRDTVSVALPTTRTLASGTRIATVNTGNLAENSWVYLTGQIVTGAGSYIPYDPTMNAPNGPVEICYVQNLDRVAGIRVCQTTNPSVSEGAVLDVMAQVTTKDGERMLGIPGDASSIDTTVFAGINAATPKAFFINNKALCGGSFGNNPSVTGGVGLYNVGSKVKVCGKIVGQGLYYYALSWVEYIQIDDGSAVPSPEAYLAGLQPWNVGSGTGVIVLSNNGSFYYSLGDYVVATGISSILEGPGNTCYRSILFPSSSKIDANSTSVVAPLVATSGAITLNTKVYGEPNQDTTVHFYASNGWTNKLDITCDVNGVGTGNLIWTGFPKTLSDNSAPHYTVSAKCEGFKTRVYADIVPGSSKNVRLVPLRKITLDTSDYEISTCPGSNTATLTAKVVDANNAGVHLRTVRFYTDQGTFASDGSELHSITASTDASGYAQVVLYASYSPSIQPACVTATDDLTTPLPVDSEYIEDPIYNFDWQSLRSDASGHDYITISAYQPTLTVTPESIPTPKMKRGTDLLITATLQEYDWAVADKEISFEITTPDNGTFGTSSDTQISETTDVSGVATAYIHPTQPGWIHLRVSTTMHGQTLTQERDIEVKEFSPQVTIVADPDTINAAGESIITFHAKDIHDVSLQGLSVQANTNAGSFLRYSDRTPVTNQTTLTTGDDGNAKVILVLNPAATATISGTFEDDFLGSRTVETKVRFHQPRWNGISVGVGASCPLVDDLFPGGGTDVGVIAKDGYVYIWDQNGVVKWKSPDETPIDYGGNNTLSCADIDNRGGLQITAPASYSKAVYAYGYDSSAAETLLPLAGWPAQTERYEFQSIAAALGDVNLDGTTKVIAADFCCYVTCWNAMGGIYNGQGGLWTQLTQNWGTSVVNSSVALGDTNSINVDNHILNAVVGAHTPSNPWSFAGNEWKDYSVDNTFHLSPGWRAHAGNAVSCSPVIGLIDSDSYNDVAIGDDAGGMLVHLNSNQTEANFWQRYEVSTSSIKSSPIIVNLDGQKCIVFGCDDGRVYAIHADGSSVSGWAGGIVIDPSNPQPINASPICGNVVSSTTDPQVIVASTDGNVYALWKDGANHSGGAVARIWTCVQSYGTITSTPTLCSLDGTHLDMIVASSDGIYRIRFDGNNGNPNITFDTSNYNRWPWRTFHYNNARTGCSEPVPTTKASASIVGRVVRSGVELPGANVKVQYSTNGTTWYDDSSVYGQSASTRTNPVTTVGTSADELNKGGFVINQLTPGRRYRLVVTYSGSSVTYNVNGTTNLPVGLFVLANDIAI